MKGTGKKTNAKLVVMLEIAMIVSMSILFYCLGMGADIIWPIFVAGGLIVVIPTSFFGILSHRSKKDVLFYAGAIVFLGSYGCFFRDIISAKVFGLLVVISFCMAAFPLCLTALGRRDTKANK